MDVDTVIDHYLAGRLSFADFHARIDELAYPASHPPVARAIAVSDLIAEVDSDFLDTEYFRRELLELIPSRIVPAEGGVIPMSSYRRASLIGHQVLQPA